MKLYFFKTLLEQVSACKLGRLWQGACLLTLLCASQTVMADPDPCDFSALYGDYDAIVECYRSVPYDADDRDNIVESITGLREATPSDDLYDQQHGWRARLNAIANTDFDNDFDMIVAFEEEAAAMGNGHFQFNQPSCYRDWLSHIPISFGSMMTGNDRSKQAIFVDLIYVGGLFGYENYMTQTGYDVSQLLGVEVVSIDGRDPKEVLAEYRLNVVGGTSNASVALNRVLSSDIFTAIRRDGDEVTERASLNMVVKSKNQIVQELNLPFLLINTWAPGPRRVTSTEQFHHFCKTGQLFPPPLAGASEEVYSTQAEVLADLAPTEDPGAKLRLVEMEEQGIIGNGPSSARIFEVPPGQVGRDNIVSIRSNFPITSSISEIYQFKDDVATIMRIDHFSSQFQPRTVRAVTEYACANSEKLVIDLRHNPGGLVHIGNWLVHFLDPNKESALEAGLVNRNMTDNVGLLEVIDRLHLIHPIFFPSAPETCLAYPYDSGCFVDGNGLMDPGTTVARSYHQFTDVVEPRGIDENGNPASHSLTKLVAFDTIEFIGRWNSLFPPGDSLRYSWDETISCPGKFTKENLIIIADGANASMGWFFPNQLRDVATLVTTGGIKDVPMPLGGARGGNVTSEGNLDFFQDLVTNLLGFPPTHPFTMIERPTITFTLEVSTYYHTDGVRLTAELELPENGSDLHVDVWGDAFFQPFDGYVYQKVINAAEGNKAKIRDAKGWDK